LLYLAEWQLLGKRLECDGMGFALRPLLDHGQSFLQCPRLIARAWIVTALGLLENFLRHLALRQS
jgi:hypothetical protein